MKKLNRLISTLVVSAVLAPMSLFADTSDEWQFGAAIYGWFPDISGTTNVPIGDGEFTIGVSDILDNLEFTFQGSFDARKGNWGFFSDVIYMDIGATKKSVRDGTVGDTQLPWEINGEFGVGMKSLIWTNVGYYRLVEDSNKSFDMLAGVRYADVDQDISWSLTGDIGQTPLPGREGEVSVGDTLWDIVVGFRGQVSFGAENKWFIPYYADIGTGDADLTYQLAGGIGYRFNWGGIAAMYRYMEYDVASGKPIDTMDFSGPAVGAVFRW